MVALPILTPLMPIMLAVACANVMVEVYIYVYVSLWLIEMLAFTRTSLTQNLTQTEEVQTLQLQQDVSEWLVCLNNVS